MRVHARTCMRVCVHVRACVCACECVYRQGGKEYNEEIEEEGEGQKKEAVPTTEWVWTGSNVLGYTLPLPH